MPEHADRADALLSAARGRGKLAVVLALRAGPLTAVQLALALGWGRHAMESMLSRMVGARLLAWERGPPFLPKGPRRRLYRPEHASPAVRLMLAALDLAEDDRA
jgi:hypothetical protein